MSTNTYIGYILKSKYLTKEERINVCENDETHKVKQKDNFCSICGSKTISKVKNVITTPLDLWQISIEIGEFENLLYSIEDDIPSKPNIFLINSFQRGCRFYEYGEIETLDDKFFNMLDSEFESHEVLHEFIKYVKEKYGDDAIEVIERQIVVY